jgi:hypothetical protein
MYCFPNAASLFVSERQSMLTLGKGNVSNGVVRLWAYNNFYVSLKPHQESSINGTIFLPKAT